MKEFLSEYGGVIIAALVVVLLIAIATVLKTPIANSCSAIVNKLKTYVEGTLDNAAKNNMNETTAPVQG